MQDPLPSASDFTQITTPRLLLRPYNPNMASDFWQLIDQNRERLLPDFPDRTTAVVTLKDAERRIRALVYQWNSGDMYSFGIWQKDTEKYLGDMTLRRLAKGKLLAEVGYYLDASAEGQGIATEALKAVLQFAFTELQMEVINLRCGVDNAGSQRTAQRCGFTRLNTTALSFLNPKQTKGRPIYTFRLRHDEEEARRLWSTF